MIFEGAEFAVDSDFKPHTDGQRRTLVEQYYANIDFASWGDINRLLAVYGEVVLRLRQDKMDLNNGAYIIKTVENLLKRMEREGFSYSDGRFDPIPNKVAPLIDTIRDYVIAHDLEGLRVQIERLVEAAGSDPALAVGTAKEMVETVCKTILEDRGITVDNDDMGKIVRSVVKELALLPDDIPEKAKGSDVIRRVLSNLSQISQGLAELRNLYGTGHGRSGRSGGIRPRHARLAVGAAVTFATFLLETHLEQESQGMVSPSTNGSTD